MTNINPTNNDPVLVGTGPLHVIALHGWYGSSSGWGDFPAYIDGDAFTYAFADYRGYGQRRDVTGDYSLDELSSDVIALADELGWETFALLGHSMGGLVAQAVLAAHPERVTSLYSLSGVPAGGGQFDDDTYAFFEQAPGSADIRSAINDRSTGGRLGPGFLKRIVGESLEGSTVEAFGSYLPTWVRGSVPAERLEGITIPVKVAVGEHDADMSAELMRATWLQTFPQAELEVIPNAGHYATHETPPAFAASVSEFFTRAAA